MLRTLTKDKMALTRIIGDIHGLVNDYKAYSINDFDGPTIQVGDFGVGFGQSDFWHESVNDFHRSGQHRFIRGNHDNPSVCKEMVGWIPDGRIENDVMFVGGAWSIDNPNADFPWYRRTENVDWWANEECSDAQFQHFIELYSVVKPRVMITHDCPLVVSTEMFFNSGLIKGSQYTTRTAAAFDAMIAIHQPDEWYFGHWHFTMQYKYGRTMFQCIGELDYVDVEL